LGWWQLFDQAQFCAAGFWGVSDLVKYLTDDVDSDASRADFVQGAALYFVRFTGFSVVPEDDADLVFSVFHEEANRAAFVIVGVPDHVGACFVNGKNEDFGFRFAEAALVEKIPDGMTHGCQLAGIA
jgi:hypothetical protein